MSPGSFIHEAQPMRVVFGCGAVVSVSAELERLGLRRVLLVSSAGRAPLADALSRGIAERSVGVHPHAAQHVPVAVADDAVGVATRLRADGVLAVGGGSAIGLAKAIALRLEIPVVAVPTTYSGSEMTPVWGLTDEAGKRTGRDPRVLPSTVVYDPDLTVSLPSGTSAASGLNAVAHAVEALYAAEVSPVVALMAEEGVRALADALPTVVAAPTTGEGRSRALYGAWLCGACLGSTTMGLHHKLCHVLGGRYDLPHAETHAALLPHVLAFNVGEAPDAGVALRRALGIPDVAGALYDLAGRLGLRRSLGELAGRTRIDQDAVVAQVMGEPPANPRPVDADSLHEILTAAIAGSRPS